MADQFAIKINSYMDLLLDNNMNTTLENFNSSDVNLHGFMPMSADNFSVHQQMSQPLSFMSVQDQDDGTIDVIQSLDLNIGDHHQSGWVYDPINHFPMNVEPFGIQRDGMATTLDSIPPVIGPGFIGENKRYGSKKRKKNNENPVEIKPADVVHVRAKRGEATDSHSLAERTRREKINEKLRRLQDLVPGCYKTMGMSVMLDVIINYVRSLQNQIEFLSMKLSAASMFYDFNSSEMDDLEILKGKNGREAPMMERMVGQAYAGDLNPRFQSTWSP